MSRKMVKTRTAGVYKRMPHGTFMAVWRDADGRRRTKTCETYAEACDAKHDAEEAKRRGERRVETRQTLAEYLETWIDTYTGRTDRGISAAGLAEYRRDIGVMVPKMKRVKLTQFGPEDGRKLVRSLLNDGRNPSTVRRILTPLRAALADAVDDGKIASNPMQSVRVPKPRKADETDPMVDRALTDEQVATIIDKAPERYRLLIRVIAMTGLRRSEALALQWRDIATQPGP